MSGTGPEGLEDWRPKDLWYGALFLFAGALVISYAWLAMQNGVSAMLWFQGWIVGPFLALFGIRVVLSSLRALWRRRR